MTYAAIRIECDARSVKALGQNRTFEFNLNEAQIEALRAQLPRAKVEIDLLDRATEALISRLIGERIEAQVALRRIQLEGLQCSACGCYTKTA